MKAWMVAAAALMMVGATNVAEGQIDSRVDEICCGGGCCLIDGMCRTRNQTNPANSCQECDPGSNNTDWTDIAGCVPAGTDSGPGGTDAGPGDSGGGGGGCSAAGASGGAMLFAFASLFAIRRRR